jgi:hypothetical protein
VLFKAIINIINKKVHEGGKGKYMVDKEDFTITIDKGKKGKKGRP